MITAAALAALAGTGGTTEARAAAGYSFAPYLDLTGYPTPDLAAIRRASGVDQATLAFVTARDTTACAPSWGGYATDPASGPRAFERGAIAAFRRGGGQAVISFGGQAGAELASTCKTVSALTQAYQSVIAAYHPSRLDFDIEGTAVADPSAMSARLGLTPMIGINDVSTEAFTLTDARTLAAYARTNRLGLLSMWQLGRDRPCAEPTSSTQIACSSVNQAPYAFSRALEP